MRFPVRLGRLRNTQGGMRSTASSGSTPYTPYNGPPSDDPAPFGVNAGSDQTVSLGTTVNFSGSVLNPPDGVTLKYKWTFDDEKNPTASSNQISTSYTYPTSGVKTATLTVSYTDTNNQKVEASGSVDITVIELTLNGPATVTRGKTATYTATVKPDGLNPTFEWEFTGGGGEVTEATGTTKTWAGQMVVGGAIMVTATVNKLRFTKTLEVNVSDRDWEIGIPFIMNDGSNPDLEVWGTAAPTKAHDFGEAEPYNFEGTFTPGVVGSGPNKDFKFLDSLNLRAPIEVRINIHFWIVKNPPRRVPQTWTDFMEAQGDNGEIEYEDLEPAVRIHEGHPGDLVTDSHYKHWHVDVLQKGTSNDPARKLERIVKPPSTQLKAYETHIQEETGKLNTAAREAMAAKEEPISYLFGGKIDLTYPDPD